MVGWFGDGHVPCLTVSTLENRLVTCRRTWCYKLQNLNVTEGDRKQSQRIPFLGQPCSWQCIKKKNHKGKPLLLHNCRGREDRPGKTQGEETPEVPPATSWRLCHKVELGSNQTISVCLEKNHKNQTQNRLRVSGHFLGFCISRLERKET